MDPSQLDALRTRLNVCKDQYNSPSTLNTRARKAALLAEIESIERQLADALGLQGQDSDNEAADDNDFDPDSSWLMPDEMGGASSSSHSLAAPSQSSPSGSTRPSTRTLLAQLSVSSNSGTPRGRSPSPDNNGRSVSSKRARLDKSNTKTSITETAATPIKPDPEPLPTSTNGLTPSLTPQLTSSSSSTSHAGASIAGPSQGASEERKSITAALIDAGVDDDVEELLRAQLQLERELAEKRRLREEEDERLARMLQEEEYQIASGTSITAEPQRAPSAASVTDTVGSVLKSNAEKAQQERADFEMARLFAESEARSFNLATMRPEQALAHASQHPPRPAVTSTSSSSSRPLSNPSSSSSSTVRPITSSSSSSSTSLITTATARPTQQPQSTTPTFSIFNKQPSKPATVPSATMANPYANYPPSVAKRMAEAEQMKKQSSDIQQFLDALERANSSVAGRGPALGAASSTLQSGTSSGGMNGFAASSSSNSGPLRPPNLPPKAVSRTPIDLTSSRIDLTRSIVDLTRSVVNVPSDSDDEDDSDTNNHWDYGSAGALGWHHYSDDEHYNSDSDDGYGYLNYGYGYGYSYGAGSSSSSLYSSYGSRYQAMKQYSESEVQKELQDLLSNIKVMEEIPPEDRLGTPEGMARNMVLLEHQKIGLTWLQKMEDGNNKGGILADDMGLGKTVQSIALMVSRRGQPPAEFQAWNKSKVYYGPPPSAELIKSKTTLIVAPVGLVYQWENEIINKTTPGLLRVHVHYRNKRNLDPQELSRFDVIITSYGSLSPELGGGRRARPCGNLFWLHYHRVILDEAHMIKNKNTKAAIACKALEATYRLCLTGTPFQNKITELFSLIQFLRIRPYDEYGKFARDIANPIQKLKHDQVSESKRIEAMHRLQALMKAICLRRSKKDQIDGKPILHLPQRNVNMTHVQFSQDEADFYHALETRTVDKFNAYVKAGTVMKNYTNVLLLLLRLRQACCHPHLIKDFLKAEDAAGNSGGDKAGLMKKLLDKLSETIITRLLRDVNLDAPECPICMDVGEHSVLLSKCGHIYCKACIAAHLERHEPEDRKCPECRGLTKLEDTIPVQEFVNRYRPAQPEPEENDPKGKGKAVDTGDRADDALPKVPAVLDEWMSSAKIDKMVEIVQRVIAKGEKIIIFSQFTTLLSLIERPLVDNNVRFSRYDGSVNPDARNRIIQDFMNPNKDNPVMLISLKCGSLGLNLVAANHVIMMDPWWNPAIENQAIDRVHRIGQTRDVHVYRLAVPGTVEDRIYRLQEDKQALIDGALGESDTIPKLARLNLQDLIYLFRGTRN